MRPLRILLAEPFCSGSHRAWAEGLAHSLPLAGPFEVRLLALPGRHWKWRMHGGALALAEQWAQWPRDGWAPDLLLASDMLDLSAFAACCRHKLANTALCLYFHENQLTYPWSPADQDPALQRDRHYAFINYASAKAADRIFFNSDYHRRAFLDALPGFLGAFPDFHGLEGLPALGAKSMTLPLGLDLRRLDAFRKAPSGRHLVLWNHRWEYDKNPEAFFRLLFDLLEEGWDFDVAVLGESYRKRPPIFEEAARRLQGRLRQFGYAETLEGYASLLWEATLLPVTAVQDFFGISVAEAMYCGTRPLLPRRLAYPEHIPEEHWPTYSYGTDGELAARMRELLAQPPEHCQEARDWAGRWDWGQMAQCYAAALHEATGAYRGNGPISSQ